MFKFYDLNSKFQFNIRQFPYFGMKLHEVFIQFGYDESRLASIPKIKLIFQIRGLKIILGRNTTIE